MLSRRHFNFAALLVLILSSLLVGQAAAQTSGVTMKVEAHFSGHFKFGEWLPLRVTLANDGPALRAEVRAEATEAGGQMAYVFPVELPTGARKQITLYVQPPSFARAMRVRLMDGDRELAVQTAPLVVERNVNYVVGVIAPRAEPFAVLGGLTLNPQSAQQQFVAVNPRPVIALPIKLSDIPNRPEGLRLLDALIISGVDTSELDADQSRALQGWVEGGGRLILGGGASAARTLSGLPPALVQDMLAPAITTELPALPALDDFAGQAIRVPGPFVVTWSAAGYDALIEQDGYALVIERRLGEGRVNYVALDVAASPFDAWAGAARFWEKLLTPGSAYSLNLPPDISPRLMQANALFYALQNLPALALPSIRWLGALLIVYIVLVGPVNYVVLRRLRKLEWGWLTIPALTLLFSVGAFALGYRMRGGDVIINQISIITFNARRVAAPMQTYVGIFSPERRAYTVTVLGQPLLSRLSPDVSSWGWGGGMSAGGAVDIVQGEPSQLRGVQVDQWAMQAFQVESAAPPDWKIESALAFDSDRLRGLVTNRIGETLQDVVIVQGNRYVRLGNLEPGQSLSVDQPLQNPSGASFPYFLYENIWQNAGPAGPPRDLQIRQQILDSYWSGLKGMVEPPARATLIGWIKTSPLDVRIADARWTTQQTALVIAELEVQYPRGPVRLSPGSLTARLVSAEYEAYMCSSLPNQLSVNHGTAILEFQLPEELARLNIAQMTLRTQGGGELPTIEFYTRDGEWSRLESPHFISTAIPDPARFILPGGLLRMRLSSDRTLGNCVTYDFDIEGTLE